MTRGTVTNKQTGLEITGEARPDTATSSWIDFQIDGTHSPNAFHKTEWDFTPEPEPIKDGVYTYRTAHPEDKIIRKYRNGQWRDADGYALANQNVDVSELVRLVPEA